MILFPNAKINLGLHILSKRKDNFHNLETLMVPIGLCDVLEFLPSGGNETQFKISGIPVSGEMKENLVFKAYLQLKDRYKLPHLQIHLHKIIPAGAGLGGGSSDAAFMLKGLNKEFELNLSVEELKKIAGSLGSDCSFFIENNTALASGKGEKLLPTINYIKNLKILVFYPGFHVSTADAYSGITPDHTRADLLSLFENERQGWKKSLGNDFEKTIFKKHPVLKDLKDRIYQYGALYASMSGSGSSVYGLFEKDFKIPAELQKHLIWEGMSLI